MCHPHTSSPVLPLSIYCLILFSKSLFSLPGDYNQGKDAKKELRQQKELIAFFTGKLHVYDKKGNTPDLGNIY